MLGAWQGVWTYLWLGLVLLGAGALAVVSARLRAVETECRRERRGREEMEAYLRLDLRTSRSSDLRDLGERVCGVIAARSVFQRVAMLAHDAGGELYPAGSQGMDDKVVDAVRSWAAKASPHDLETAWSTGVPLGSSSVVIFLGENAGRAIAIPLRDADGRILGALVACAESVLEVQRLRAEEAVVGLEALGTRLTRALEAVEPVRRVRFVERLAGKADLVHGRRTLLHGKATVSISIN